MTCPSLSIRVSIYVRPKGPLGGNEILLQNAAMDATTQFEDINHSAKAQELMRGMYIGDFLNPEEQKESWEDYTKRK